jgi:hypothetical protein
MYVGSNGEIRLGQVRKTKVQIENECREIYKLRKAGNSYDWICQQKGISLRNFYKVHYKRLAEMAAEENQRQFSQQEMSIQDRMFRERLENCHTICVIKSQEKGAQADWIKTAVNIDVLLTRLRHEGFMAFNVNEYRRITQRVGEITEQQGTDVLQEPVEAEGTES